MSIYHEARSRNVTAVLGPTNTGKTHLAIERMLGHASGLIGLPLRLLAREVYDKIVTRVGADKVALVTGEEKIKPENPRYWVCTVEAMPREIDADFVAIDEVQLASDPERGHVFCDRLLHTRGRQETLLLGAGTMREAISDLIPGANFISRPRLSKPTYSGQKKITRPAGPISRGGILDGRGLCHRRADPPPAGRRRGGARRAVAAHAQCPGRALPVGRRRLHRRHRRDRHGPEPQRRPRGTSWHTQVRRPEPSDADAGRARADRRPRRPTHERRHVRGDRRRRAARQ